MKFSKKSSINAEWHKEHPMPKNPTLTERTKWHKSHVLHCTCRPIPASLLAELEKQNLQNFRNGKPDHSH